MTEKRNKQFRGKSNKKTRWDKKYLIKNKVKFCGFLLFFFSFLGIITGNLGHKGNISNFIYIKPSNFTAVLVCAT